MHPPSDSAHAEQLEAERALLAALCQPALDAPTREAVLRRLNNHSFAHLDHEIIYRALAAMPPGNAAELRGALARRVTQLGFPDVDIDFLFSAPPSTPAELAALLERL